MPNNENPMSSIDMAKAKAAQMLKTYRHDPGMEKEPEQELISDVVADLMHYCQGKDIDFDQVIHKARVFFDSDIEESQVSDEDEAVTS